LEDSIPEIFVLTQYIAMLKKDAQKSSCIEFVCELCHYNTSRKSQFERHLLTAKHNNLKSLTNKVPDENPDHICCNCNKKYKSRVGLWYHKKKCNFQLIPESADLSKIDLIKQLIIQNQQLIFENKEFKELILDQSSKMLDLASKQTTNTSIANINNNMNCNNKNNQFNLNVFLNEKCKNAMNMSDFIDSIKVNDEDFENIGKLGYVQGISNIFIKNLQKLDECIRPMHCSDAKREVIYIKENNEWKKDENQKAVRHVIAMIAHKNFKYMPFWTDANPGVFDGSTKKNDLFLKITNQITTAITPDDDIGICKIIRNVANRVVIDKKPPL